MNIGLDYSANNYYINQIIQQKESLAKNDKVGFDGILSAKETENTVKTGQSFMDMWQSRFPGAYYHTLDAYQIPQGIWERLDFPHDDFFSNKIDKSILNWKPTGKEPKMTDRSVQSRAGATLGKKSIVVPPVLEEKMKNDPTLAKQIMGKVNDFILAKEATKRPHRICSYIIVLDEEGEIAHTCITSGGVISEPTEETIRQFEEDQRAKRKRRMEYMRIVEESSLRRAEIEQEHRIDFKESDRIRRQIIEDYGKSTLL